MSADRDGLLARQERVTSRAQAFAAGMTRDGWRHRMSSGRWRTCGDGVAIALRQSGAGPAYHQGDDASPRAGAADLLRQLLLP